MTSTSSLTSTEPSFISGLVEATSEVFETMVFTTLEAGSPMVNAASPASSVMGAVRFLGTLSGTVSLYTSDAAACEIAGLLLGCTPEEAEPQLADAVGEITNMIAGTFRAKVARGGQTLMITTPTVTRGCDFSAQHFNVTSRMLCPFAMGEHTVHVELILQVA